VAGRSLVGMKVQTEDNAHIGRINNVVVNKDGRVDYAVVKVGGFLGLGSKKVTVAWNELRVDEQRGIVKIAKTKDQLMSEPEFREAPKAATG
jgi:sporulation protein YlmC with PRC-barrel domain